MSVIVTTEISDEPISVALAKQWCNVESNDFDDLFELIIPMAREWVENYTGRALKEKTLEYRADCFPRESEIELEFSPLRSVQKVEYVLDDETLELDDSLYDVDIYSARGRIVLKSTAVWPQTDTVPNAVIVTYTAGYDPYTPPGDVEEIAVTNTTLPKVIMLGLKFLIAHFFANRDIVVSGVPIAEVPFTITNALFPYRVNF